PHGRVLHQLAPLTTAGGDALLLSALAATRHRLDVVAAFRGEDLDPDRLRGPGSRLLADLLSFAEERAAGGRDDAEPQLEVGDDVVDRLVIDLAERLWRAGFIVEVGHGLPGGLRIPLVVGHRDLPDRFLVAVLTDDDDYMGEPSVRVRDRQVAGRLERLGWVVSRVWSAAAFLDPQAEADAIARLVHEAADRALATEPRLSPVGSPPRVEVELDDDELEPATASSDEAPAAEAPAAPAPRTASVPAVFQAAAPAATGPDFDDILMGTRVEPPATSPSAPHAFSPVTSPATPPAPPAQAPAATPPASTPVAGPSSSGDAEPTVASPDVAARSAPARPAMAVEQPAFDLGFSAPSADSSAGSPSAGAQRTAPRPPIARGLPIG